MKTTKVVALANLTLFFQDKYGGNFDVASQQVFWAGFISHIEDYLNSYQGEGFTVSYSGEILSPDSGNFFFPVKDGGF